jgi:iron complex transport system permease protein
MRASPLLLWGGGGLLFFVGSLIATISIGSANLSWTDVWQVIASHLTQGNLFPYLDPATDAIVWQIRAPRVLLSAGVGATLALSGLIFQAILRNPLADPYILGVSSGAAAGAVCSLYWGWTSLWLGIWLTPICAMIGAVMALLFVWLLARTREVSRERLILAGVIVQVFFGAFVSLAISLADEQLQRIMFWLLGSLNLREWSHVEVVVVAWCMGFLLALLLSQELNLLALGERMAAHLGVYVRQIRFLLLTAASMLAAAAVSVTGTIGFVGFVIPHIFRRLIGHDHRLLVPFTSLGGAIFLMWADCLARTVIAPRELPIGVITAFVGAPFFAFLLRRDTR